jgi:hypothetical protein
LVDWAIVNWGVDLVPIHQVDKLGDGHLYAVLAGIPEGRRKWRFTRSSLLYLGMAFRQHLVDRIRQDHSAWDRVVAYHSAHRDRDLLVRRGWFPQGAYSTQRLTQVFVEHVEQLLIAVHQPAQNTRGRQSSGGRPLVVINVGERAPLKQAIAISDQAYAKWKADGGEDDAGEHLEFDEAP